MKADSGYFVSEDLAVGYRSIPLIREIIAAGRNVNPNIMVICHGGPIADPEDAAYIIQNVPEIDGFFGASSIERLASERSMTAQAAAFKAIAK